MAAYFERAERLTTFQDDVGDLVRVVGRLRWRLGLERILVFGMRGLIASALAFIALLVAAWFGSDGFRLFARQSGRFVAVGVPLSQTLSSAVLTARFHKIGGPAGGGYGLIVRDQGSSSERDGRNQAGQYMVLEVGDQGDVGIWQRNETRWIDVMPWTHSEAVNLGRESNALVVTMRDNVLRLEVNGQVLADLSYDGIPPRGGVGVFVGGDLNEVVLDSLRIET